MIMLQQEDLLSKVSMPHRQDRNAIRQGKNAPIKLVSMPHRQDRNWDKQKAKKNRDWEFPCLIGRIGISASDTALPVSIGFHASQVGSEFFYPGKLYKGFHMFPCLIGRIGILRDGSDIRYYIRGFHASQVGSECTTTVCTSVFPTGPVSMPHRQDRNSILTSRLNQPIRLCFHASQVGSEYRRK